MSGESGNSVRGRARYRSRYRACGPGVPVVYRAYNINIKSVHNLVGYSEKRSFANSLAVRRSKSSPVAGFLNVANPALAPENLPIIVRGSACGLGRGAREMKTARYQEAFVAETISPR